VSHIQAGRWSQLLRKATGQAGIEDVTSELAPEISPTWQLESDTAEWDYLKSTKRLMCNVDILGHGSGYTSWRLRNPLDSGTMGIVDQFIIGSESSTEFSVQLEYGASDLAVTGFPIVTDSRWVPAPFNDASISSLLFTTQRVEAKIITGALLGSFFGIKVQNIFDMPVVLSPGWALTLAFHDVNIRALGNVSYRERTLPPLER